MRRWWIAGALTVALVLVSNRLAGAAAPPGTVVELFTIAVVQQVQAFGMLVAAIGQQLAATIGAL